MCGVCMCLFVWVAKAAARVCTWPTALLRLRSLLTEEEENFEFEEEEEKRAMVLYGGKNEGEELCFD